MVMLVVSLINWTSSSVWQLICSRTSYVSVRHGLMLIIPKLSSLLTTMDHLLAAATAQILVQVEAVAC